MDCYRENELSQGDGAVGNHVVSFVLRIDHDAEMRGDHGKVDISSSPQHRSNVTWQRENETLESKKINNKGHKNTYTTIVCVCVHTSITNYLSLSSDKNGSDVQK